MKTCGICQQTKALSDFHRRGAGHQAKCKTCEKEYHKAYFSNNSEYRKKQKDRNILSRQKVREYVWEYLKSHPCIDCGEEDIIVLEFDHRDNASKDKAVSFFVQQGNLTKVKEEIRKCDVCCANCHRRRTAKQFNWLKGKSDE